MKMLWLKDKYIKIENKKIRKMFVRRTPFFKKKGWYSSINIKQE